MSRTDIRFRGIVRNANLSDSSIGDCEELINVIPENGSLKIVKDKEEVSVNIPYKDVIIHEVGGIKNYIGKTSGSIAHFDPETGLVKMVLYYNTEDVYLTLLNNQVIISDRKNIRNINYVFNGYSYEMLSENLDISISSVITKTYYDKEFEGETFLGTGVSATSKQNFLSSLQSVVNKFKIQNKTYCEGIFLYAFTVTLNDGTETGMYNLNFVSTNYKVEPSEKDAFINIHKWALDDARLFVRIFFADFFQSIQLKVQSNELLLNHKKQISKINLYVSVPITRMPLLENSVEILGPEWNEFGEMTDFDSDIKSFSFDKFNISDSKIEKTLLYRQKSWTLEEFARGVEYQIEFGGDVQTTSKTMEVVNTSIVRAGKLFSYNNRIHYYDSLVRLLPALGNMYVASDEGYTDIEMNVYVYIHTSEGNNVMKYQNILFGTTESDSEYFKTIKLPSMIIYSDSRAFKMVIESGGRYATIPLYSSPSYNYAYAFGDKIQLHLLPDNPEDGILPDHNDVYSERFAINISAHNQPFVFPIEHSYLFAGRIKALGYATEPISQTQIGQYPLYVFTDKGIYAMEQGSGVVLYANQILINTDNVDDTVVQTRNGVIYIANGGVYVLSGRNSLHLSLPINGPIDTDIRRSVAYSQCCISDTLYNAGMHISQVEFEKFLPECRLIYIPHRDELVVSNPKYQYSYVFSFIYKTWYKITDTLSPVDGNVVQKHLFLSESVAKAAKGSLTVSTVIVSPEHQFTSQQRAIYSGTAYQSDKDERFALIMGGTQISSVNIQYPTKLPIIIALLCKDVPYLDCMYDGASHYIYSSMDLSQGATVQLVNTTTNYTIFEITFEEHNAVVTIPAKGVGDTIKISSAPAGTITTRQLQAVDNVLTVSQLISAAINNAESIRVTSDVNYNILTLVANTPGEEGNNIALTYDGGDYVGLYSEKMSGGKDISLEPGDYTVLLDYTKEKESYKMIHLQSRPMSFTEAYSIMRRMVLHCRAKLQFNGTNLSMYLFASNNMVDWACVSGSQKKGVIIDHIRLQRSARAYKYYIVIIGGTVRTDSELSYISAEIEERFNSKLR